MREKTLPSSLEQQGYPANHAIVFPTDANYWPHVATAIKSLFVQSHFPLPDIYVFYDQEKSQWIRKLNRLAKVHKQTIHFRRFGLELLKDIKINKRLGFATYFRIYLPDLLEKYKYILYLDSDLIATSDISSIFSQHPTGSHCIAARTALKVELIHHNERFGRRLDTPYFNAGVLLIDAVRWRERKCTDAIKRILIESPDLCIYADQDALNLFFDGNFQELPYQYNVTRRFYEEQNDYSYPGEEILIREAAKAPILVHFSGPSKPWHLHNKHPFRHRYRSLRGSFHWYPYSLCISLAELILELRQKAQPHFDSTIHFAKDIKASMPMRKKTRKVPPAS